MGDHENKAYAIVWALANLKDIIMGSKIQ